MPEHIVDRTIWRMAVSGRPMSADMSCPCGWMVHLDGGPRRVIEAHRLADEHEAMTDA